MVFTLRWGIISTGGIATEFSRDLLVDPATRGTADVAHEIAAVGSRTVASAQKFVDTLQAAGPGDSWRWGAQHGRLDKTRAYGDYHGVYNDPNVDVVYVGTPPNMHYENVRDALLADKHVLCEKPFTFSLAELDELIKLAKERRRFLMEAVWTRFHPLASVVKEVLASDVLGKPKRFSADFSMDWNPDNEPAEHRMINPTLGGGSLLDMGPYPSVWAMLLVHRNPHNADREPRVLCSYQTLYERTNVDLASRWLVDWNGLCQGSLMCDLGSSGHQAQTALLQCEQGDLVVEYPPYRAETMHVVPRPERFAGAVRDKVTYHCPIAPGNIGLSYEADHVARCVRDGATESEVMPLAESRVTQGWLDTVRVNGPTALRDVKGAI